ncbi:GAP family protein [Paeniglutamicibacter sp. NPDC012692]|uniref:GAP family protein n=1 Tax=Paeniglutamicibacter sp. NPDC012692 TaxID=3364388 RepID=UPI0036A3D4FE
MIQILGETLPYAITIAISPVPIIATILMLMSPRPKPLGLGFLLGWVVGICVATGVFTLLAGVIPEPGETTGPQPIAGTLQLLFGVALLFMALKQWRSRPAPGVEPELPKWMAAIDTMKPPAAIGLGFLLAAVNPKNLLVAAAAGMAFGRADLGTEQVVGAVAIFTVIAALSVLLPVLLYLVAPAKAAVVLDNVRTWLTANNATIMMVVLLVLGTQLLGKGLGSF